MEVGAQSRISGIGAPDAEVSATTSVRNAPASNRLVPSQAAIPGRSWFSAGVAPNRWRLMPTPTSEPAETPVPTSAERSVTRARNSEVVLIRQFADAYPANAIAATEEDCVDEYWSRPAVSVIASAGFPETDCQYVPGDVLAKSSPNTCAEAGATAAVAAPSKASTSRSVMRRSMAGWYGHPAGFFASTDVRSRAAGKARPETHSAPTCPSSHAGTASIDIFSCCCVSRWRMVTVWDASVSLSIVMQNGVPASSMRA